MEVLRNDQKLFIFFLSPNKEDDKSFCKVIFSEEGKEEERGQCRADRGSSEGPGRREKIHRRESRTGQQSLKAAGNLVMVRLPISHVNNIYSRMHSPAAQGTWSSCVLSQQEVFFIYSPTQASFPEGPAGNGGHFQQAKSILDDLESSTLHEQSKLRSP